MRCKRGKANYTLPRGLTRIERVMVYIDGAWHVLRQIGPYEKVTACAASEGKPELFIAWGDELKSPITLIPAPAKAWKLKIIASQTVEL